VLELEIAIPQWRYVCAGSAKVHRFGNDGNAGFLSGPDINLPRGLASLNTSKVFPQAGQTKLSASREAEWNSVRS
jgi:hypothetical protein